MIRIYFTLLVITGFFSCNESPTLFKRITSDHSGIHFNNEIQQTDSINVLDFSNVYNGGGVGIADFNNDGLQDLYFTGNLVSNKLYLNRGDFRFEDITEKAGVSANGKWCRGVAVVDINNDGLQDMYVCASVKKNAKERENMLFINKGPDKNGVPVFADSAAAYGLNDTTHSTQAAFFDYDNDGDLDVYILVNDIIDGDYPNRFRPRLLDGSHPSTGRLYRNDWNETLHHAVFTNVSKEAGMLIEGYGHGVAITDINADGWKDIYVSNDYLSNNILYINNHDGTFTDQATTYFKHTAANAMGNDVNDINNDGLLDIIELDMNPEDNYRKKMMMNGNSYQTYQNIDYFQYQYQYVRNTLQLNLGPSIKQQDSIGPPAFADIAFYAGVAETDWSWTPMVVDFDNDGYRDIIVTNGFPRDVTDHDFVAYRAQTKTLASKQQILEQVPEVRIYNYAFHNNGNCTFSNKSADWGLQTAAFSNGASYADLDNDGDLDMVVNNINDEALVYRNAATEKGAHSNHLRIHLNGSKSNINGIGAWIEIFYNGKQQVYELNPVRGYLSSVQLDPHFGLDSVTVVDSVRIKWPAGKIQVLTKVPAGTLIVHEKDATQTYNWDQPALTTQPFFTNITSEAGLQYQHKEEDFIDFNIQKLLPHKMSEYGPALAAGDVDGNGLDDLVCGGAAGYSATLLLQQSNGKWLSKQLITGATPQSKPGEDMGLALVDADGDHDLDLYIASGSYEFAAGGPEQADHFYLNDGRGNFKADSTAIPRNLTSKSCVRAADYDKDGDPDLFIAGRVLPGQYPKPVPSFIYRNDSKNGRVLFTDVTASVAANLQQIGLISDATWTDFDNDGWPDLLLAGEWMPLTFLKNDKGRFINTTPQTGLASQIGWWNSLLPGDFDNDGDMDYVAGNLGLNSFYRASTQYPVHVYAKDVDNNGSYDAIPTLYLPNTFQDAVRREYVAHTREDMVRQIIATRAKYPNYKSYANASFTEMFKPEDRKDMLVVQANDFHHVLIRNNGNGQFEYLPLPMQAQFSCINGMLAADVNNDGFLDIVINGNDYGTEVSVGRYDGCNGLLLLGDGKGGFKAAPAVESGIFIPGNGKALVQLRNHKGQYLVAASQNRGPLQLYRCNFSAAVLPLDRQDVTAIFTLKQGGARRQELYDGASFLSQSARIITIASNIASVDVINTQGVQRRLY